MEWGGGRSLEWSEREDGSVQSKDDGMDWIVASLKKQKRGILRVVALIPHLLLSFR